MNNTLLDTYPFLSEIAKRLSSEQAAVMVGSGFSKNATPRDPSKPPFPDWSELGDILHARLLPSDSPRPKFLSIPEIASELQASIGRPALDDILTEAIPDNDFQPSHLHKQLLDLPWSDVFTTNYDTLLDRAVTQVPYRDVTVIRKPSELVYSNSPRLIKLHGCISDPSTCVVTDDDYRNYPKGRAPFVNAVCQSLVEKTLCLVGFSARDPNFITWINWTLESLGRKHTPRIYLVAVSGLTQAQQVLLTQRNISVVDMSVHGTSDDTPYTRMEAFLEYLDKPTLTSTLPSSPAPPSPATPLRWPTADPRLLEPKHDLDKREQLSNITSSWAQQRSSYPGWIAVPEERRRNLWLYTHRWINYIANQHDPQDFSSFDLFFELIWRMDKCLCPLFENLAVATASFLDTSAFSSSGRCSQEPSSAPSSDHGTASPPHPDHIKSIRHYLLLALMRYYREEGDSENWQTRHDQLSKELGQLSPRHKAHFYYEKSLCALFDMHLPNLQRSVRYASPQSPTPSLNGPRTTKSPSVRRSVPASSPKPALCPMR